MTKIFTPASDTIVDAYWTRRPDWCRSDQSRENAATLLGAAATLTGGDMLEIGSSAGEGAAALLHGSSDTGACLVGIDLATHVYYDKTKPIGAVISEAFPEYAARYSVLDGCTSKRVRELDQKFALVHIDGAHSHPWALLDMLNVLGVLEEGALILLDDAIYHAPLSQAAYFMAYELEDFGEFSGRHFTFEYPGPTDAFINALRRCIALPWQTPIPMDEITGLLNYLRNELGDLNAAGLTGDFLAAHEHYMRRQKLYEPLNQRVWKNEIELRKSRRGGTPYGRHE